MSKRKMITIDSNCYPVKTLFSSTYEIDFYQREYVWGKKQIEDLIDDLSNEFLKNYQEGEPTSKVKEYTPYFMGEIIVSQASGAAAIIDGQQRITSITLLLIYLLHQFGNLDNFPNIKPLIYSDSFGEHEFTLNISERKECMKSLLELGEYDVKTNDTASIQNLVERYNDIVECFPLDVINNSNICHFTYWLCEKIMFSKVYTDDDDFAYVIFETMNDRGLSLTPVEMLRSYLLANVDEENREIILKKLDSTLKELSRINLVSKTKSEFEFFKVYLRSCYAQSFVLKDSKSDYVKIGKEFHRWIRDNSIKLNLKKSDDFIDFINKILYFADIYINTIETISTRNAKDYLYLLVNNDFGANIVQHALILASVKYGDSKEIIEEKTKIVSKYLTKTIVWRVWNHWNIDQGTLEHKIYPLCAKIRNMEVSELKDFLENYELDDTSVEYSTPSLNRQNVHKMCVLLSLITEIVAKNSGESNYILNNNKIEVEHIWANHFERHLDEFTDKDDFLNTRNNIGDLLVLPKQFNAAYNDDVYEEKVKFYEQQNILAQSLCKEKYTKNPGFVRFKNESGLNFKPYEEFTKESIKERAELYKEILKYEFKEFVKDKPETETVLSNDASKLDIKEDTSIWNIHSGPNKTYFLENDCIGINWEELGPLNKFNTYDELYHIYEKNFPDANTAAIGHHCAIIWNFYHNIKIGDLITYRVNEFLCIGKVTSDYYYNKEAKIFKNQRKVNWFLKIEKKNVSEKILKQSGAALTLTKPEKNFREDVINLILENLKNND